MEKRDWIKKEWDKLQKILMKHGIPKIVTERLVDDKLSSLHNKPILKLEKLDKYFYDTYNDYDDYDADWIIDFFGKDIEEVASYLDVSNRLDWN